MTSRDEGGRAATRSDQAVCVKGISRPSRRLKRRLTTQAREFSPEGRSHGRVLSGSGIGENARVSVSEGVRTSHLRAQNASLTTEFTMGGPARPMLDAR
jgi:hypothetical protein